MAEKLKPCPFCGGAAKVFTSVFEDAHFVDCTNDDCYAIDAYRKSEEEAIEAWNRRAEKEPSKRRPKKLT